VAEWLIWWIPGAPLLAALLMAFLGKTVLRAVSPLLCVLAVGISAVLSLTLMFTHNLGAQPLRVVGYDWLSLGDLHVNAVLQADGLSSMMLVMVTVVATLVAIYAAGYMKGDPGTPRFFAEVSLFVFSMTMLVLSGNLLLLYVFWEAVGLCSYLLIGFWFEHPPAAAAAKKAFLVNRIGDFGFALGIFLLWMLVGRALHWEAPAGQQLLDYDTVFQTAGTIASQEPALLTLVCLLLFAGAVGKSAQFPLHVWLPDAMEGPTPVSALIHAATMVTAGVYMVCRLSPVMVFAPQAQAVVATIGGITALLAALIALTQFDLKRILAYSTVSQLGLMFVALGCGASGKHLLPLAAIAAMFHLFNHAFFKALLFLNAGSVMHSMGNVIDIRQFGGLRRVMPVTHWTFLVGALALAGIPPLAGFWSKDEILAVVTLAAEQSNYESLFGWLRIGVLLTSGLTAFYVFRAYFLTFWGPEKFPKQAGHHPHESPPVMTIPLIVLACAAAGSGLLLGPTHYFFHYVSHAPGLHGEPHPLSSTVMATGTLVGFAGFVTAWWLYIARPGLAGRWARRFSGFYRLSLGKFFFDEIYTYTAVKPLEGTATVLGDADKSLLDWLVDWIAGRPAQVGRWFRKWQSGLIQSYAALMFLGVMLLAAAMVWAA
jgi:NADH-quinone oxidoreductase subunit L